MTMIVGTAVTGSGAAGYQIQRSLRFNSADSAYLNRTPASAGNRTTWTWSCWLKRSNLGSLQGIFTSGNDAISARGLLEFEAADTIRFGFNDGTTWYLASTVAVFRDPSAFYHIVIALDLSNGTNANRVKLYINNVQQTFASTPTWPTSNQVFNNNVIHRIGAYYGSPPAYYLNGYLTEVNFIDGQALTPSSFGQSNPNTGVWEPIRYTGTYGTNGFYLNFSDNSNTTAATLGKDSSGNGNNWTPNGFSVTAGAGNDSLVDTPTSYGTDTGAGGEVRGNYATLNPLNKGSNYTLANGNLDSSSSTAAYAIALATFGMTSGKWYWEVTVTNKAAGADIALGICKEGITLTQYLGQSASAWSYATDGKKYNNNTAGTYGSTYTTNDVIGIAFDADNGELKFYKNGTVQNSGTAAYTGLTSGPYFPASDMYNGMTHAVNFGQRPFAYTAPSGFKALCTQNLPTPTIGATSTTQANDYMNVVLYTGNGAARSITGLDFQPDFVWIKSRSNATWNALHDAVRGSTKELFSNSSDQELTNADSVTSFNSNGFSLGADTAGGNVNVNNYTYVAWNWKANGAGSTNTAGSITSTVSANTTSGFSIVTYTGNNSSGSTVGHGLGVAPKMIVIKSRSRTTDWLVWHTSLSSQQMLVMNSTAAAATGSNGYVGTVASTNFQISGISTNDNINFLNATYVAYCFAAVAGYSAFGSYTGNGSTDGPMIFTGFRPKWIMIKRTDAAGYNWFVYDSVRDTYNVASTYLRPNLADAETTASSFDMLSNGIKIRNVFDSQNASGGTYIYAAFCESPFKYSLAQ